MNQSIDDGEILALPVRPIEKNANPRSTVAPECPLKLLAAHTSAVKPIGRTRMIEAGIRKALRFVGAECGRAIQVRKIQQQVPVIVRSTGNAVIERGGGIRKGNVRQLRKFGVWLAVSRQRH